MQKRKKRQRTVRLIRWGMGTGRRIGTAIVALVLVLVTVGWLFIRKIIRIEV